MDEITKIKQEIQKHLTEIERTNKLYNSEQSRRSSDISDAEKRKSDNYLKYLLRLKAYRENRIEELKVEMEEFMKGKKGTTVSSKNPNHFEKIKGILQKKGEEFFVDYNALFEITNQNSNFTNRVKEINKREGSNIKNMTLFKDENGISIVIDHNGLISLLHCSLDQQVPIFEVTQKKIFVVQMAEGLDLS